MIRLVAFDYFFTATMALVQLKRSEACGLHSLSHRADVQGVSLRPVVHYVWLHSYTRPCCSSVTMTAETMLKNGVADLMPNELIISTNTPATEMLYKLECVPILTPEDPGYSASRLDDVVFYRRAVSWPLHASQVHPVGIGALSVLCGLAKSPGPDGVKALKHYLCWLNTQRHLGITWGGNGNASLVQSPPREIKLACIQEEPSMPYSLIFYSDSDLRVVSRYCGVALFNRGCIFVQSRLQHSAAPDITSSEAFAFSIAAIMADVIRGIICDFGLARIVQDASSILTDNDAVKRIASNAGSLSETVANDSTSPRICPPPHRAG